MVLKRADWPEVGDLVVATVTQVTSYGAYASLNEYEDKPGLLHISEISARWVRNIREYAKEGQKVVLKVLRVDSEKGHVDLSLRRVTGRERKEKLLKWKQDKKAETLLKMAAEHFGTDLDEAYKTIGSKIEENFGTLYAGFEAATEGGEKALAGTEIPKEWITVFTEIAKANVKIPKVKVSGILKISSLKPNGVNAVREALIRAKNVKKPDDAKINIYTIGAPRYKIEVEARDYKEGERLLKEATSIAIASIEKEDGLGEFNRKDDVNK